MSAVSRRCPPDSGVPVKPIGQFLARLAALEAELRPGARIAVVGGGAGGTELALALARRYRERARIVLVCDTAEPLADAPSFARSVARTALVDAGVELACGGSGWRLGERQAGAVRRQLSGSRNRALGDRRGRTRPSSPPQGSPATRSAAFASMRRCAASATASSSPPATAQRSRTTRDRKPASGRCAPARRWPRTCAAPPAVRRCDRWRPQSRRAGHRRSRRWPRSGLAQRNSGIRLGGVALEGLDRPALDADVPGADGANAGR